MCNIRHLQKGSASSLLGSERDEVKMNRYLKTAGLGVAVIMLGAQAQALPQGTQPAAPAQPTATAQAASTPVQGTHPTQTAGAVDPNDDPDRMICRSIAETGSLVRRTRQCFTRAQWDRINEGGRNQAMFVMGSLPGNTSQ